MRYLYLILCLFTLVVPSHGQEPERIIPRSDTLSAADVAVDAVVFSPDGSWLVTGGRDGLVQLWKSGDRIQAFFGHETWVSSLAFSPDGSLLASGDRGGMVYIRQVANGETQTVLTDHQADITGLAFSPDGTILATGDQNGQISLYHIEGQTLISQFNNYGGGVRELAFSPDGQSLVTGSEDGSVWLWGLWGDDAPWIKKLEGHTAAVTALVFSSDGSQLLTGSLDATLRLWDIRQEATTITDVIQVMTGHQTAVMGAALLYDDRVAVSISLDGSLHFREISPDATDNNLILTLKPDADGVPLLHLAENARTQQLAISDTGGTITLYDVQRPMMATVLQQYREQSSQTVTVPGATPQAVVQRSTAIESDNVVVTASTPLPVQSVPPATPVIPAPAVVPTATPLAVAAAVPPPDPVVPITPIQPVLEGRSLAIPSVGIRSYVGTFPLDGVSWAIDPWESAVGHFQGTAWFGQTGNIVLGGHSEYPDGSPGIFGSLYGVGIGDDIYVSDGNTQRRYVVVNIQRVHYQDLSVVYPTSHNRLTLITCDIPSYVQEQNIYYERLVIVADEVQ